MSVRLLQFRCSNKPLEEALNQLANEVFLARKKQINLGRNLLGWEDDDSFVIEAEGEGETSTSRELLPWDMVSRVGVGEVNEDGTFDDYKYKFYPANFGGVIPLNMFDEFTASGDANTTTYVIVNATCGNDGVATCSLSVDTTPPGPSLAEENALPATLDWVVGVVVGSSYFNIAKKNLIVKSVEAFRETDDTVSNPFQLPFKSWFKWEVS